MSLDRHPDSALYVSDIAPGVRFAVVEEETGEITQTGTFTSRASYDDTGEGWPTNYLAEGVIDGADAPAPLDVHAMGMTCSRQGAWATKFTIPYPTLH